MTKIARTLIALCVAAAISDASAQSLRRSDVPRVTEELQLFMMNWALSRGTKTDPGATTVTKNEYVSGPPNKALAACVNWEKSTPKVPHIVAYGRSMRSKSLGAASDNAMKNCEKFAAGREPCTCVVFDQNDKNVLKLPESFVTRHFR
jgi:hypothetical protein